MKKTLLQGSLSRIFQLWEEKKKRPEEFKKEMNRPFEELNLNMLLS
jgi:hypothetical protein